MPRLRAYKPYLASRWHDEFDEWADAYVNPFADLLAPTAYRNWDSERRLEETESQGIVAEVLFPNTVPPFFAQGNLTALEPTADDYEHRWAGVQAHNRWLADFCAAAPGRRAGCIQVFLNDLDAALDEIRWAKEHMHVFGGVLLPERRAELRRFHRCGTRTYEPLWDLCEELDVICNVHAGSGLPDFGEQEAARAIMLIEIAWYAHRAGLAPDLRRGARAPPEPARRAHRAGCELDPAGTRDARLVPSPHDAWAARPKTVFFGAVAKDMSLTPSEYFQRNFWVGASFLRPSESPLRYDIGIDRIMWGADYPHSEGSYPYTTEALRAAFAECPPAETRSRWSRRTRPRCTTSTSPRSGRSAIASGRRSTT